KDSTCRITIEMPIESVDYEQLEMLFSRNYSSYVVEFGRVYSVCLHVIKILHKNIFDLGRNISIVTHKNSLNRYLHSLGFSASFYSLVKDDIVNCKDIEVVLIGGSADSSNKIINFVSNMSIDTFALVIVQHVEPHKKGKFDEILQNYTTKKVSYATQNMEIQKGRIYLAQSNKHLKVKNGKFELIDEDKHNYSKPSISLSYESFSNYYKNSLVVVQECGYACDGVDKLKGLIDNNTTVILQDKCECEAKPMIINAMQTQQYDYIFTQDRIIDYINFINLKLDENELMNYLLEKILITYDFDLRLYQKAMLKRRLEAFMINHRIDSIEDAIGSILFNSHTFKVFFLEVSINVTEFFRHPKSVNSTIELLQKKFTKNKSIKIWSAGCSSGKEAYSTAIILDFLNMLDKSIIYATDFNRVVIENAKAGLFSNKSYKKGLENSKKLDIGLNFNNYVTKNGNFVTINDNIKDKTLFFQHNLATDKTFNEFDIIVCKNVIIYFDDELQKRVFKLFYDSLKFGGYLVLGKSEALHVAFTTKFKKSKNDCKIFQKVL
ncbi:MAG: CheR family methyltransferase, partial [Campylobacterota bacterium]|nr:CheR family methyltransferase [Campylobacterota bacterium]